VVLDRTFAVAIGGAAGLGLANRAVTFSKIVSGMDFTMENPKLNENAWQAWILKNRELDRIGAVRRLRLLQIFLLAVAIFAMVWGFIR
jgi:hypothetical protein